jgi:pyrimidine operon attenuation protein/uracil phosphoribosyltransferase
MTQLRETLDARRVQQTIDRLAREIVKAVGPRADNIVLIGIQRRGVLLAQRLQEKLQTLTSVKEIPLGAVDITLYRDDLGSGRAEQPMVGETHLDFDINDKIIILVDDVLFTGRTVRSALNELIDFGRPSRIYLAVLVDRGHRELPIAADFAGERIPTHFDESVDVHLNELDGKDEILVFKGGGE